MWNLAKESDDSRFEGHRSRLRTSRATRTTTRRSPTEEPEREESEEGETEEQQYQRYMQSSLDEVSDPELWRSLHH